MPDEHAKLSPSDAERWISCPAAIRVEDDLGLEEEDESIYAKEGTLAHSLAELKVRRMLEEIGEPEYLGHMEALQARVEEAGLDWADMQRHTDQYAVRVDTMLVDMGPGTMCLVEQRVQTGIDRCWGTGDAILVSPEEVRVVDFKYGQGVRVLAEGNPQLKLYAVGALESFGDLLGDVEKVSWAVFQPRLGHLSTASCSVPELREWRDSLKPVAAEALAGSYRFGPSQEACRWCPVSGKCKAQSESIAAVDFGSHPDVMSPEEIAELLPKLESIKSWCEAVEAQAFRDAYHNAQPIPGYKVVLTGGRRYISDHIHGIQRLIDKGFKAEQVADFKIKGIGALEKVVGGRGELEDVMGELLAKTPGKPALVPESDKRDPVDKVAQAAADFGE